jgi:hypothetical protein
MPYRKQQFVNNEIYHIITRAIDNNLIFKDIHDYSRGIFSIYEFNNIIPVTIQARRKARNSFKKLLKANTGEADRGRASIYAANDNRDKLVEVLCFCFMRLE